MPSNEATPRNEKARSELKKAIQKYGFLYDKANNLKYLPDDINDDKCFAVLELILKQMLSISCFSIHYRCPHCEHPKLNPLMLAHYADKNAGIVIEYRNNRDIRDDMFKISYECKIKHFRPNEILGHLEFDDDYSSLKVNPKVIEPLRFKFSDWRYQNEYRIFYKSGGKRSCSDIDLEIKRIYFGVRVKTENVDKVLDSIDKNSVGVFWLKSPVIKGEKESVVITDKPKKGEKIHPCD